MPSHTCLKATCSVYFSSITPCVLRPSRFLRRARARARRCGTARTKRTKLVEPPAAALARYPHPSYMQQQGVVTLDVTLDRQEQAVTLAGGTALSLTSTQLRWSTSGTSNASVEVNDLLGCSALDAPPRLVLHAAPKGVAKCFGPAAPKRVRQDHTLKCDSFEQATNARAAVVSHIRPPQQGNGGGTWLVLINPFGGGGKAPRVWKELEKLVEVVGLTCEIVRTTHAGHAREIGQSLTLGKYDGILSVSGDGLLNELVNGLMARPDAAAAAAATVLFPAPGGTGNGLFRSICARSGEAADLLGAAMIIARGRATPLDLWQYISPSAESAAAASDGAAADIEAGGTSSQSGNLIAWSFLSFSWGIVSDVDIESEALRSLGALRFTLWALWRVLTFRTYSGTLHYLDAHSGEWKRMESSKFVGIWACNVPYMSMTDYAAPQAEFDNGALDLLVMVNTNRVQVPCSPPPSLHLVDASSPPLRPTATLLAHSAVHTFSCSSRC